MKIVGSGGTSLIGSKTVVRLRQGGHEVVAASPKSGINSIHRRGTQGSYRRRAGRDRPHQFALIWGQGGAGIPRNLRPQPSSERALAS
jgi:nucleoside-diphosphate-sugar epimerase